MSKYTVTSNAAGIKIQQVFNRPVRLCAAAALLLLQGCAASSYYPVAYSRPVAVQAYQAPVIVAPAAPVVAVSQPAPVVSPAYSTEQIDQLMGPIALYPDPLLAQLLPASTYPLDIVRAAQLVRSSPTEEQISAQDWDASVKAMAHYPTVLEYMDKNLDWTQELGRAFMAQPDDVMRSVQRLRQQASVLGNLVSTPQQQVVIDDQDSEYIRIIPMASEIVYVPVYQPAVIYYQPACVITFGFGCRLGSWLDLDCDWRNRCVYRPGWTWNHWHNNIHVEHDRITHFERHDSGQRDHASDRWQRDSRRPIQTPGHDFRRGDSNDRSRWTNDGNGSRDSGGRGRTHSEEGRRGSNVGQLNTPSPRGTGLDTFGSELPPSRPNVPGAQAAPPAGRPPVPSARPGNASRPSSPLPGRVDTPVGRPPTPSAQPAPSRPIGQAPSPAPSRPPTPGASGATPPSRPSVPTPAPSRPSTPAPSPTPSQAPSAPPRAAPSAPPSRPSTPSPGPSAAPRPSNPSPAPSDGPSRPDVPRRPR